MGYYKLLKDDWDKRLSELAESRLVFAPIAHDQVTDYELVNSANPGNAVYNIPKPVTSLKTFFLPVKENVSSAAYDPKPRIIIGIPNCDIEGLKLLDEIYLDSDYPDIFYWKRRESTLLISADCFGIGKNCHCTSYGLKPYSESTADLSLAVIDNLVILKTLSAKGEQFINTINGSPVTGNGVVEEIIKRQKDTESLLAENTKGLPDYSRSGILIENPDRSLWNRHGAKCVACGACTAVCPTCTCFLLIDRPGFEKIRQMDACQYPGFERVAGGEDPLHETADRFRNRYMCKYNWRPRKFRSTACTGCGRCIDACIGRINKNEVILDLAKS